jgi:hypothetical protein
MSASEKVSEVVRVFALMRLASWVAFIGRW